MTVSPREGDTEAYERALETLYRAPLAEFIGLRGRLATDLRKHGDRPGAARLMLRRRPSISAWAVNQLYWRAHDDFDRMRAAAERLRAGDLDATDGYRRAIAVLRRRAADVLQHAGHGAGDAVLGRVANTLAGIAATGFEPDGPGTLSVDRDPPGFDIGPVAHRPRSAPADHRPKRHGETEEPAVVTKSERVAELAERRRAVAQARQARERQRLERELAAARADVDRREQACVRQRAELRAAEAMVAEARERVQTLEHALHSLDAAPGTPARGARRG